MIPAYLPIATLGSPPPLRSRPRRVLNLILSKRLIDGDGSEGAFAPSASYPSWTAKISNGTQPTCH